MVDRYHLDNDFLVVGLSRAGAERDRLLVLAGSEAGLQKSAVAWYEFCRGPRTPDQLARARVLLDAFGGVVPFDEEQSVIAGEIFRQLGSPRRRAADIAIAASAMWADAKLLTRNVRDFNDISGIELETVAADC